MAIKIPIISELNKTGFRQTITEFKKLETNAQRFKFVMSKATSPAGLASLSAAATTAAYAIFNMAQSAADDQKSQAILATALKNTTGATDDQVASVEDLITKMQMASGIADTDLRTGFQNLARATQSVTKSQKLLSLAVDVSVGTGRSLESVTIALGKAYGGNISALKRLGVPIDENTIKTKNFEGAVQQLSDTFGGSAAQAADTMAGKFEITKQRIDEAKEAIGNAFIPIISNLVEALGPAIESLNTLADAFAYVEDKANNSTWWRGILGAIPIIGQNFRVTADDISNSMDSMARDFENNATTSKAWFNQIGKVTDAMPELTKATNNYASSLAHVETPLQKFLRNLAQVKTEITSAFTGLFDLGSVYSNSKNFQQFMGNVQGTVKQIRDYGKNLLKLRDMGLGPAALQGILGMDLMSGATLAEDLLQQSNVMRDIGQLNTAYNAVSNVAGTVGGGLALGQATGVTQNITITNPNPKAVVQALREYGRNAGPLPLAVTGSY